MEILRATLFKTLHVQTGDGQPLDFGAPTTRSLFAYLLLHRTQPVDRRRLAFQLWPRGSETAARRNLRQYIHRIRRVLEEVGLDPDLLLADGSTLQINPKTPLWLDTEAFQQDTRPGATLEELQTAIALYTGDLLEDLYEDWCEEERQSLRQRYLQALERLTQTARTAGRLDDAILYTQKRLQSDPFDEDTHRDLMRLFALNGDRARAIQHYQTLRQLLEEELDAEPLPETQALLAALQKGGLTQTPEPPPVSPRPPATSPPLLPPSAATASPPNASPAPLPPPRPSSDARLNSPPSTPPAQTARAGQGQFLLLCGESGIGKTRLIQDYLDAHPNLPVLRGVPATNSKPARPTPPLRAALERSLHLLPAPHQALPPWLVTLAPLSLPLTQRYPYLPPPENTNNDHTRLADAFAGLIASLSASHPGEPSTSSSTTSTGPTASPGNSSPSLSRRAATLPLLIVGLCRMEDLQPDPTHIVRTLQRNRLLTQHSLRRLTEPETETLTRGLLDEPPAKPFFRDLYRDTEGNPFFIIETVRAWREGGWKFSLAGGRHPSGMPLGIQQVIEARLERLTPQGRELLGTAAVIGREFTFAFLQVISQQPEEAIIELLEEWVQRGLVREEPNGYDFSHDKIRQVAYAGLSRARRQYNHRRIAQALENMIPAPEAATLAYHFRNSDQAIRALPYLTEAGEQALRVRSYQEAREFGQQAVSLLGQLSGPSQRGERIDLNLQLAQAYAFTGDWQHALEILSSTETLAQSLGDEQRLGKLFRRSAQIFWLRGQPEVAGDCARRALRVAEELSDEPLLHAALRMLGRVGIALSTFDDAIAYLLRYVNLEQLTRRPPALPSVLGYLGVAYGRVGSWERALEAAERGVILAEADGAAQTVAFARMQLAFIFAEQRAWEKCLEALAPVSEAAEEAESLTPLGFMLLSLKGRALVHMARAEEGVALIRTALAWGERIDHRIFYYLPRQFLAEGLFQLGDLDQAVAAANLAITQAAEAGNRWSVAVTQRLLAEILTQQPTPDWPQIENHLIGARNTLRETRARPDLARTYLALRRLYDRAGQIAWAVDCHFRATTIFEETGMGSELRQAQGHAAGERKGAVVIPNLKLRGPNVGEE
ncbi:MAG: winged helix-turn-helix domain-containing protein [Anaerolineales bacterium]|nr:winged helix-turn-helix domain-containing protein [Anaerolineales bacterium]